eukprot:gene5496-6847_t
MGENKFSFPNLEKLSLHFYNLYKITASDVKLVKGMVPLTVRNLTVSVCDVDEGFQFTEVLERGSIPDSVESLRLDHRLFKHDPHGIIPGSCTTIYVENWHSREGDVKMLPPSIRTLGIPSYDNGISENSVFSPGSLPSSIVELYLSSCSMGENIILPGSIPNSVKQLKLITKQRLPLGVIPDSIEELEFNYLELQAPLEKGLIPRNVKVLKLDNNYEDETIYLDKCSAGNDCIIPFGLIHLETTEIWTPKTRLPPTLTYLECGFSELPVGLLPPTLQSVLLNSEIERIDIGSFPKSLTKIKFLQTITVPIVEGIFPSSLTTLYLYGGVYELVPFPVIPSSVKKFVIGDSIMMKTLKLQPGNLPDSIEKLIFEYDFVFKNQSFQAGILPSKLKSLDFRRSAHKIDIDSIIHIPNTLQSLKLPWRSSVTALEEYHKLITRVLLASQFRLTINVLGIQLLSTAPSDPYFYYTIESINQDEQLTIEIENESDFKIPSGSIASKTLKTLWIIFKGGSYGKKDFKYDQLLELNSIPDTVENLTIDHRFIRLNPLGLKLIPPSVTMLGFHNWDSKEGEVELVPMSVKHLSILYFDRFNQDNVVFSPGSIPPSIISLGLGSSVDFLVGSIPNSVKILYFPPKIQLKPGILPDSIEELDFGFGTANQDFQQPGIIPNGIKSIFSYDPGASINFSPGSLPPSLEKINSNSIQELQDDTLPTGLTHLDISSFLGPSLKTLPPNLTILSCKFSSITKGFLPPTLTTLTIKSNVEEIEIGSLPDSLTSLKFEKLVQIPLVKGVLPPFLKKVEFTCGISSKSGSFPVIPPSVITLALGGSNSSDPELPIGVGDLPDSIEEIEFLNFVPPQQMPKGVIPSRLKKIKDSGVFSKFDITQAHLPDTIQSLEILAIGKGSLSATDVSTQKYFTNLFNNCKSLLQITIKKDIYLSFDCNDPYIYYQRRSLDKTVDGFLLKSNFITFINTEFD